MEASWAFVGALGGILGEKSAVIRYFWRVYAQKYRSR